MAVKLARKDAVSREAAVRHWDDIGYTAVLQPEAEYADVIADFKVYEISGWSVEQPPTGRSYGDNGGLWVAATDDQFEALAAAPVFLSGGVKWDGCSNWRFDAQDDVMLHFCAEESAADIGKLFSRLYEWARELGMDRL